MLNPQELTNLIREKLHVKRGDCLPFTGWDKGITRNELASIMGEAGFKVGAEIGVRKGDYSKVLCERIPGLKIYCVDPYIPYRGRKPDQEKMDALFAHAQNNLKGFNATFIRKTSMEAANDFKDGSLDFVYIDAMHEFDPVMMDIIHWTPKVRVGGIVAGHDYIEAYDCGVINAVRAYTFAHGIHEWYLTWERISKNLEFPRSWFLVRK